MDNTPSSNSSNSSIKSGQAAMLILSLLVIAGFGASIYFYTQYQKSQQFLNNPGLASQIQIQDTTKKVASLMTLPTDEQPTIATVTDVTKLKDQPFFKGAKNGDKVLLYPKNKKAILYSVSMNKILDVEPINITPNTPAAVRISVYNGAVTGDSTSSFESQLTSRANNVTYVKTQKAAGTYAQTVVVDTSGGQFANAANQLAQLIGATVVQLPTGETKPDGTDLLVILGINGYQFAAVPASNAASPTPVAQSSTTAIPSAVTPSALTVTPTPHENPPLT